MASIVCQECQHPNEVPAAEAAGLRYCMRCGAELTGKPVAAGTVAASPAAAVPVAPRGDAGEPPMAPRASVSPIPCSRCGDFVAPTALSLINGQRFCSTCMARGTAITRHLRAESELRATGMVGIIVGALYALGGVAAAVSIMSSMATSYGGPQQLLPAVSVSLAATAWGIFSIAWGVAMRGFKNWARITGCVVSILMAIHPANWLTAPFLIWLYFSPQARTVTSPGYDQVMAATPHLRRPFPITAIVLLSLILLVVVLLVVVCGNLDFR